jgi:hypothetical protein
MLVRVVNHRDARIGEVNHRFSLSRDHFEPPMELESLLAQVTAETSHALVARHEPRKTFL